jgi:hypothetical protein
LRKLSGYVPLWESVDTGRLAREMLLVLSQIEAGEVLARYPRIHLGLLD